MSLEIVKVGSGFAVEYFQVKGNLDTYTDDDILSLTAESASYGRVFRKRRNEAEVEIYNYEG